MTFVFNPTITDRFSRNTPVSMAQGRHGELIIVQGNGVRPARWAGTGTAVDAGVDPPESAPQVSTQGPARYYIARVDVTKPGACYYAPPELTFKLDGSVERPCKAAAYLNQAALSEVRVLDGGKGYQEPPTIELSDTHGKGAVIEAVLDEGTDTGGTDDIECNDRKTGITSWEIVENGGNDARFTGLGPLSTGGWSGQTDLPINGNGTFTYTIPGRIWVANATIRRANCVDPPKSIGYTQKLTYTVSGVKTGSCAVLRLKWWGGQFTNSCTGATGITVAFFIGAERIESAEAYRRGKDFSDDSTVRVTIRPVTGDQGKPIVVEGMTRGNENNVESPTFKVASLKLVNGGSGYLVAPQLKIVSQSGFGAYATCKVKNGKIVEVLLENGGGGYKTAPTVEVVAGGAEAFAVARPHLRGKYQCYYRYIDDTPESKGGPIPSNLSPVLEVDAGEGKASATWTITPPSGRAKKAELWRSSGNQATTLYRVATTDAASFTDTLTDDELRDPDREGYAAMPIVLPNGEINANRFGIPPSDKSVVVRFQDRFWYGVDTGGDGPNTIYYSEVDEPESVPESNEIILQQNARDADKIRALIPFGSTLLVMQERHAFSLTFARTPVLDAQVTPMAYRGCLNQRCWDIYDGVCYVLDQYGVYSITPTGALESVSDQIDNLFRDEIDFSATKWAFLLIDAKTKTLRAFVSFREDGSSGEPTRVLCYSLESKSWWYEKYPQRITGGTQVRLSNGDFRCVYAGQSGPLLLNEGASDLGRGSVVSVTLIDGGSGYRTPPTVTAPGGSGALFQAHINAEGQVTSIWITSPGFGYASGALTISPPNDPNRPADARAAQAVFTATDGSSDTPLFTTYRFKGGSATLLSEALDPKAASEMQRGVTLAYDPQLSSCEVALRTYYNNSDSPRYNVASRNRGVGFSHSTVDSGARYDMAAPTQATGADSGVATALFSGRTLADIKSADRNISVELAGARKNKDTVVFYGLDIAGTVSQEGG